MCTTRIRYKNKNATTREGNIELNPPKKHRNKKKNKTTKNKKKSKVPYKTGQQKLTIKKKEKQTTLLSYT